MIGIVAEQVVGQAPLDNAAARGGKIDDHLGHRFEQAVGNGARIRAIGQERHELGSHTLVVGGHLVERFAAARGGTDQQLVIVKRDAQLHGEHLADLVALGTVIARDGDHDGLTGAHLLRRRDPALVHIFQKTHCYLPGTKGLRLMVGENGPMARAP